MVTIRDEALKRALVVASLMLGLALPGASASACSCTRYPTFEEAVQYSEAIFTGVVVGIEPAGPEHPGEVWVILRTGAWWKGNVVETARVLTGENEAVCGFSFEVGKEYLVYALPTGTGLLWTHLCWRTHEVAPGDADFAALGPPIAVATLTKSWGSLRAAYR